MKYRVIEKYTSAYPNPIKFQKGEPLITGGRDDEYPGWILVTTKCGNEGWAPDQYININTVPVTARQDYDAAELSIEIGQTLVMIHTLNDWAWVKTSSDQFGWVPCKTIQVA